MFASSSTIYRAGSGQSVGYRDTQPILLEASVQSHALSSRVMNRLDRPNSADGRPEVKADTGTQPSLAKFAVLRLFNDSGEVKAFTAKDAKKGRKVRQ